LLVHALSQNRHTLWYVAPSYRQAKTIAWRLLKKLIPEGVQVKYNESELSVYFQQTGSFLELKGADNEDSLRGVGIHKLVIDEFASIYDNWSVWHEVLRPMLTDTKGDALFIGTPKGKDSFFELFMRGQRNDNDWKSWRFKTVDNPYIDTEEVQEAERTMPGRYFRQEYEASFEDFVGLIYPEFGKAHIIEPRYLEKIYPRIGAIDPAIAGTMAALKGAVDEEGIIYIYNEFYEKNVRVSEVAPQIAEDKVKWVIDPASASKNIEKEGKLYSLYNEFADRGIQADPAENDVEAGINRVGEYFKQNKLKIFKSCTNLQWELERYHYVEPKDSYRGQGKIQPYKKDDHLVDCLRYMVMSRPKDADINIEKVYSETSVWGRRLARQAKKDGFKYGRD